MEAKKKALQLKALAIALGGFILLVGLLNFMNSAPTKKRNAGPSQVQFEVKKVKDKTAQKIQKKPEKQKSRLLNQDWIWPLWLEVLI